MVEHAAPGTLVAGRARAASSPLLDARVSAQASRLWEVDVARTARDRDDGRVPRRLRRPTWLGPGVDIDPSAAAGGRCRWPGLDVPVRRRGEPRDLERARPRRAGSRGWALYRRHARRAAEVLAAAAAGERRHPASPSATTTSASASCTASRWRCSSCRCWCGSPPLLLVLGVAVIAAGSPSSTTARGRTPRPPGARLPAHRHRGVNWYPLLPWLGPAILGLAAGPRSTRSGRRGRWGRRLPTPSHARALGWPGRHALPDLPGAPDRADPPGRGGARPGRRRGQPGQDPLRRRRRRYGPGSA